MLPQPPPPKPQPLSDEDILIHGTWLNNSYTRRVLETLAIESDNRFAQLLDSFSQLNEAQLKTSLQQIKTQRNIITCLTKPLPNPQK